MKCQVAKTGFVYQDKDLELDSIFNRETVHRVEQQGDVFMAAWVAAFVQGEDFSGCVASGFIVSCNNQS